MFTVSLDRMKRLQMSFTSFKIVTQSVPSKENQMYEPKLWTIIHPNINVWQASMTSQSINSLDSPFPLTTDKLELESNTSCPTPLKSLLASTPQQMSGSKINQPLQRGVGITEYHYRMLHQDTTTSSYSSSTTIKYVTWEKNSHHQEGKTKSVIIYCDFVSLWVPSPLLSIINKLWLISSSCLSFVYSASSSLLSLILSVPPWKPIKYWLAWHSEMTRHTGVYCHGGKMEVF